MARIYAHKKGKSGSTRPVRMSSPSWVRFTPEEIMKIITRLGKEGKQTSEIGMLLRDQWGIPSVKLATGKTITQVLKEAKLFPEYPEDLLNLMTRAVKIRKHLTGATADKHSRRGLKNTEMKILRLVKYYRREGRLAADWQYNPETAAIIVSGR
ncbi:MAG: 30S ribosomal protein S15 [archaeon]